MVTGVEGQGPFVWPEVEKESKEGEKAAEERKKASGTRKKAAEEHRKRQYLDEAHELDPEDAGALKERARLLLQGKVRWRPSWQENRGPAAAAMER